MCMIASVSEHSTDWEYANPILALQQVLNLGQIEIVDAWHDGDVHYQKLVTKPDYERCSPYPYKSLAVR